MGIWNTLRIGASALAAQRLRLDTIANNIANAETTATEAGGPYQRQDVVFTTGTAGGPFARVLAARHNPELAASTGQTGVQVAQVVTDAQPGPRVYDPEHPDADAEGYVTYPNVNIVTEMTNMLSATRSYEAGLAVLEAAKRMALRALEIGR